MLVSVTRCLISVRIVRYPTIVCRLYGLFSPLPEEVWTNIARMIVTFMRPAAF